MPPVNAAEQASWRRIYPRDGSCTGCGERARIVIAFDHQTGRDAHVCARCLHAPGARFFTEVFEDFK